MCLKGLRRCFQSLQNMKDSYHIRMWLGNLDPKRQTPSPSCHIVIMKDNKKELCMEQLYLFEIEEWRDIKGYEGLYQVSNLGNVRSLIDNHKKRRNELYIMKPTKDRDGYLRIGFRKNGKKKLFGVHRIVAEAFIPNVLNMPEVNHKNEIKNDNRVENLEWCDDYYNRRYGTNIERSRNSRLNHPKMSKTVSQYDNNGTLVNKWSSLSEIQRQTGYDIAFISRVCLLKQHNRTAYGFIWRYE